EAGSAALHRVAYIDIPTLAQKMTGPAFPAIRRGFPGGARHSSAVPEHQRPFPVRVLWQVVLHVHLLDDICAVLVDADGLAALAPGPLVTGAAGELNPPPADMEGPHGTQAQGFRRISG